MVWVVLVFLHPQLLKHVFLGQCKAHYFQFEINEGEVRLTVAEWLSQSVGNGSSGW